MNQILNFFAKHMNKLAVLLVAVLAVFPLMTDSSYMLRIVTICMMYVMIALSLNLLTGFLGLMTMGHAAFWGIGAYAAAILSTRAGLGMGTCMIVSAVVAGLFSLLLGLPTLRLKGYYLTVVTLGFCEIVRLVEMNSMNLTRGPLGIAGIPSPNLFGIQFTSNRSIFYVMLVLVVIAAVIVYRIVHSRIGLAVMSIREDDLAASAMGVNVFRYKIMVFIISSMIVGVAGAFYAHYINFIDPSSFTTAASMDMLIMAIFGGLGSIPGTILGASVLTILPETIRAMAQYRNLVYGIIIVVLMMIKPDGILGNVNFKYIKQRLTLNHTEKKAGEGADE
ncbi:branched-chain amino acid ABC transporter permease [Ruminococcus gauvreauii]|uniref:Branched-chain amino acid ABC transporter permease n=1 Tax=Ruminococcus gauvreauii TaxID=438033 RepID=A0ABY5VLX0_9FIRM|nr:branched-chain amino acid ABC transporter permease [Ruminococcus gauvreauii]UWP60815.1 branched-chain amino acid ABC transporter permease [Ruminococcus gauvreauii]